MTLNKSWVLTGVSSLALIAAGIPQSSRAAAGPGEIDAGDTIIVTGTRDVGVKAVESPTPISVLSADTLAATGAANVFDAMKDTMPSFSASAQTPDDSEMVRSARLRGMNPGEVLVLVNGKRRHNSATVNADQDPDTAANPTDLDMIPMSMIDHVEVLQSGAAAQYGSDAVAGVINIILKSGRDGTTVGGGAGITSRGDGAQANGSFNKGFQVGNDGMLNVSVEYRHIDFMNRSNINCRTYASGCPSVYDSNGKLLPNYQSIQPGGPGAVDMYGRTYGPVHNRIWGGPLSDLVTGGFNFDKPLSNDIDIYAFGTAGWRGAQSYENDREASRAPFRWPDGFWPRETLSEVDGSLTVGAKGQHLFSNWDWDVSATYAQDYADFGVINSFNTGLSNPPTYAPHPGLGIDAPTGGQLRTLLNTQAALNADFRRSFDIGLAGPLNVATGAEFRHETFVTTAGDPVTYLQGGTQSEAGFTPSDAANANRQVEAFYVDLSIKPVSKLTVDLAGRFENYSQTGVGSTENGKLTARYDFLPEFGVRGTISDGFHAPTLAQEFYSATNVTPTSLSVQLPVGSPGAKILGAVPLVPETSKDISVGIVAAPIEKSHVTIDAYQVFLDHRIINSGAVSGLVATAAAAANGNVIPPGATGTVYATFFNNGVDTETRGLDFSADYKQDFGRWGQVKWTAAANLNSVKITNLYPTPPALQQALISAGDFAYPGRKPTYLNPGVVVDLTKGSPKSKISVAANWSIGSLDATLRMTRYGHTEMMVDASTAVASFSDIYIKPRYITDVDIGYFLTDSLELNIGGNNVFDKLPTHVGYFQNTTRNAMTYPLYTPWGIQGAYYYTRFTYSF